MADTKIAIKFNYYVPFIKNTKTDEATMFDFERWIARVEPLPYEALVRENSGTKARLDVYNAIEGKECWYFRFLRLREDNLPFMVKEDQTAKDIALNDGEYVAEGLSVIYDANRKQFMVQVNRSSLGVGALQNYLTDIWGQPDEKIILKPIMNVIDLKKFRKGVYRKIDLGFANLPPDVNNRNVTFLKDIFNSFSKTKCRTASVIMSIGHAPSADSLENGSINSLLLDISDNTDIISRASLRCSDDGDSKSELINLLKCVEEDVITFAYESRKSVAHEIMCYEMYKVYEVRAIEVAAARMQ